jgi:hypothetical protein
MRRGWRGFSNKHIAMDLPCSAVIAIFAEHSTLLSRSTILLGHRMIARRRGIPVRRSQ